jgi:hypothetical protein
MRFALLGFTLFTSLFGKLRLLLLPVHDAFQPPEKQNAHIGKFHCAVAPVVD